MGVVFVDIDGVLRRGWAQPADGSMPVLDQSAVDALSKIARDDPQLEFVLSSQWRNDFGYERTVRYLESLGFPRGRFIGQTDNVSGVPSTDRRRAEIQQWIDKHDKKRFAILDNNANMGKLRARQIGRDGLLRPADVEKAIRMVSSA